VKGLFGPAVQILNRLRYPQKFLLITALFALPLGVVMFFFLRVVQHDIEFSEHERSASTTSARSTPRCNTCSSIAR
jgi:sigma-B regulation protein RsbU (phosphoserine phosphatase)